MDLDLTYSEQLGYDIGPGDADLRTTAGLETAVILTLFSDRQTETDDILPDASTDRRGWWGDAVPPVAGHRIGSRLWLLGREKQLGTRVAKARQYAAEALQWLLDDRIATALQITATPAEHGLLALHIAIDLHPNWQDQRSTVEIAYRLDGDGQPV